MKIARRSLNGSWATPTSVTDFNFNQRLAVEGMVLDAIIQSHIDPVLVHARRVALT